MILAVTEKFHDYEAREYFIDTDKLDPTNYIDSLIIEECNNASNRIKVYVDATEWGNDKRFNGKEPGVSTAAIIKESSTIDKTLMLTIYFDA